MRILLTELQRSLKTSKTADIDGKKIHYDAASPNRDSLDPDKFKYIGRGFIYSIDGIVQSGEEAFFFFQSLVR